MAMSSTLSQPQSDQQMPVGGRAMLTIRESL